MVDIVTDTLTIGNQKINVQILELEQAHLNFYPENPRVYSALNSDGTTPSQSDIEEHMVKLDHVRALAEDIKSNGGLMEEIIVRDGDFAVLEGNSRLAAYRILAERDAVTWAKIKCKLLPSDISEELVFKLIGQFHIKGKKPWDAFEQASYLYRRVQSTRLHIEDVADELGIERAKARNMIAAVELMREHSDANTHNYSYYYEYVRDKGLGKYRETHTGMDNVFAEQVKKGEIKEAQDVRKLAKVAKVGDRQSKHLMEDYIAGDATLYDVHEAMEQNGKLETCLPKLKKFKEYVYSDAFAKSVRSSEETYRIAKIEMERIEKQLAKLLKKWEKENHE